MRLIDRIKRDANHANVWVSMRVSEVNALVEYFEAAEGEFRYLGTSGDTPMYRRLKKARAELEKEES